MTKVMTPTELAEEFGTTGREVRKFLRSRIAKEDQPGKGGRWAIPATARDLKALRKAYDEWTAAKAEKVEAAEEATDETPAEDEVDETLDD